MYLFGVRVTHGLSNPFAFIVTRAWSNGVHVTPVIFPLGMFLNRGEYNRCSSDKPPKKMLKIDEAKDIPLDLEYMYTRETV